MAITQFRLFKICTFLASLLSFFKRLICRSGRGRKLSGDQITLPTTVDFSSSVPKQPEIEEWSSWDEEAPTSIKIEGGNGNLSPTPSELDEEPDYFKDMAPTIRKTQKILLKKREPLNYPVPDGSAGFSSRLAASQDMMTFSPPSAELGEMDNWQGDANAWEDESDAAWEAEEVLRQQKMAEREKRSMEQQRKKMEKEVQRMMKKEQKIAVKLS
ncbi:receptor-binding cancer antigen expressed on SiSo cells [Siniperca chuatsi]|uniref:receptor-binding cancer antigen expressed on SiSo cells n=1 Tax=Siniperca chuatsi TaxID=119488 RepID=UPI001CE1AFB6|nr:receptor-binding cancer antigen expressed on SiSo cells [Siniperca chuatsi]